MIRELHSISNLPWCIIGDFNDLLSQDDKRGLHTHPNWLCRGYQEVVAECDLMDVPLEGYPFTWIKSRGAAHMIEERLDMSLADPGWLHLFPVAKLTNLVATHSDHSPILLCCDPMDSRYKTRIFRWSKSRTRQNCEEKERLRVTLDLFRGSNEPRDVERYMEAHTDYNKVLIKEDMYWR
ncbi:uncharacterized protein LOC131637577 [Vicia villosa]|uniref:uncharacterized protein LOC131637577 n=1 Tax=Vicia villosa TaxID=3911 RepID=UPI00273B229C|nr:uncharacterized protein LOC131637577 [Vicia villosa]